MPSMHGNIGRARTPEKKITARWERQGPGPGQSGDTSLSSPCLLPRPWPRHPNSPGHARHRTLPDHKDLDRLIAIRSGQEIVPSLFSSQIRPIRLRKCSAVFEKDKRFQGITRIHYVCSKLCLKQRPASATPKKALGGACRSPQTPRLH
jgi:hypothetical protein